MFRQKVALKLVIKRCLLKNQLDICKMRSKKTGAQAHFWPKPFVIPLDDIINQLKTPFLKIPKEISQSICDCAQSF